MSEETVYLYLRDGKEYTTPSLNIAIDRMNEGEIYQLKNKIKTRVVFD